MTARKTISPPLASLATSGGKLAAGSASARANEKSKWYRGCMFGFLFGAVIGTQILSANLRHLTMLSVPPSFPVSTPSSDALSPTSNDAPSSTWNNACTAHEGCRLAYEQSLGFFDNIPDKEWETFYRKRALYRESHQHRFKNPLKDWKNPPLFLWQTMNRYFLARIS
jgi:Methyltransferase domain